MNHSAHLQRESSMFALVHQNDLKQEALGTKRRASDTMKHSENTSKCSKIYRAGRRGPGWTSSIWCTALCLCLQDRD